MQEIVSLDQVLQVEKIEFMQDEIIEAVKNALAEAIQNLIAMRDREGQGLQQVMLQYKKTLKRKLLKYATMHRSQLKNIANV